MSTTLAPSATVTTRDLKGLKFVSIVEAPYNKARLTEKEAQRVNDAPGLGGLITSFIEEHRHEKPPLLKRTGTPVQAPATAEVVLTKELLKKEYNIGWTGDNFAKLFLGKQLKAAPQGAVAFSILQQDSLDKPILDELGEKAVTPLGRLLWHVKQQFKGQEGHLLVNGRTNIVYVEVEDEGKITLWAMNAYWSSRYGYWDVAADSVEDPSEQRAGVQVLSRDC